MLSALGLQVTSYDEDVVYRQRVPRPPGQKDVKVYV